MSYSPIHIYTVSTCHLTTLPSSFSFTTSRKIEKRERKERKEEGEEERKRKRKRRKEKEEDATHGRRTMLASCCTSSMPSTSPEMEGKATPRFIFNLEHWRSPSPISFPELSRCELLLLEVAYGMVSMSQVISLTYPNPRKLSL